MKASMWSQKKSILIWAISLVIFLGVLLSCQRRLPTDPSSRDLTLLGTANCIICNQSAVGQQDIYSDVKTKEIVTIFRFADLSGNVFGKAELTAAVDLVKLISGTTFNVPGVTRLKIGKYFTIKVTISTPAARTDYYQIDVINTDNSDAVTFFLPKKAQLGKYNLDEEDNESDQAYAAPPLLNAALSGNVVLLCLGSCETMMESRDCLLNAPSYCSKSGVSDAYIQGSMSIKSGCEKECRVICKSHDQGSVGR
jgi:hypothetical protein